LKKQGGIPDVILKDCRLILGTPGERKSKMPVRPGSGRKVIPLIIKEAKGTRERSREKIVVPPSDKLAVPPSALNKRAKQIFQHLVKRRLEALGLASASHTEMLALLCREMEQLERLDKFLLDNGFTFREITGEDDEGNKFYRVRKWPEVEIQKDMSRHVHALMNEFGLSPASAQKVGKPPEKKQKDGKDRFFD
jgi:P27 family predicted phage terminase small subunit